MKSILHETPTIKKAIEQAWHDAGKPAEFTIKILDSGEKGFLWFSKRPAIISISYDPKKTQEQSSVLANNHQQRKLPREKKQFQKPERQNKTGTSQHNSKDTTQDIILRPLSENKVRNNTPKPIKEISQVQTPIVHHEHVPTWTPEAITYVDACLKEIVSIINIASPFTMQPDQKVLNIIFDDKIHSTSDEERMLFISLSYLLMQFLKKKFKKKFKGFQLILTIKGTDFNPNGNRKTKYTSRVS